MDEGSEHTVSLEEPKGTVVKLTREGTFGEYYFMVGSRVNQANCTPAQYLLRIILWDKHFGNALEPIGLTGIGQIVSRQRFIEGRPPTQEQVDDFLVESGMVPVKQNCWLWKMTIAEAGVEEWVGDARSDNFVLTEYGIVPIDLRMWQVTLWPDAGRPSM